MTVSREDWMKMRMARDFHTGEYLFETDPLYRHKTQQAELAMLDAEIKAQSPTRQSESTAVVNESFWTARRETVYDQ